MFHTIVMFGVPIDNRLLSKSIPRFGSLSKLWLKAVDGSIIIIHQSYI